MKLTKKKLEQLIIEEYVRRIGDEGKPTNYPEYADKLTTLAKSDPVQAASLADSLDEPLDIEFNPANMKTFDLPSPLQKFFLSPEYELHFDFLMEEHGSSLLEEPDITELYLYAMNKGLDLEDTRRKIMKSYETILQHEHVYGEKFLDAMRDAMILRSKKRSF